MTARKARTAWTDIAPKPRLRCPACEEPAGRLRFSYDGNGAFCPECGATFSIERGRVEGRDALRAVEL